MSEIRFELKPVAEEQLRFELKPVSEKGKRRFKKGRKYAPILDRFVEGGHGLVQVEVEGRSASYMRARMIKLIEERGLEDRVKASVLHGVLYLEKA